MTDTRDPRYIRTAGLALLAALLVVASCQVGQLSLNIDVGQATPAGAEEPPPNAAVDPPAIQGQQEILRLRGQEVSEEEILNRLAQSGLTRADVRAQLTNMGLDPAIADAYFDRLEEERAVQLAVTEMMLRRGEERAAAVRAILEYWQELRPEDRAAVEAGPVVTPMTVRPEIRNRREIQAALIREYPAGLRDAGIGRQVVIWFYISETGRVLDRRISESSGSRLFGRDVAQFDAAALRVAAIFEFTPAMSTDDEPVPVWIQLPITFEVN